jgi:small-conductance mechanosensitive channel
MEANMIEQESLINRLGRLFRRNSKSDSNGNGNGNGNGHSVVVHSRLLPARTWGRNTAAIAQLQEGFQTLTELMTAVRQNMDSQGRRQDEMLAYLSALPKVLETIPENNRIQGETLKAIHEQLIHQAGQQQTLGEILSKISQADGDQRDLLDGLRERVETLNHQDKAMADSLNTVGTALESVSRSSTASAQVLENLRDNLNRRDTDLEQVLHRQGLRFTTMLSVAIFLAVAALGAVVAIGYLMLHSGMK